MFISFRSRLLSTPRAVLPILYGAVGVQLFVLASAAYRENRAKLRRLLAGKAGYEARPRARFEVVFR
jgi:hypothetical protein